MYMKTSILVSLSINNTCNTNLNNFNNFNVKSTFIMFGAQLK
jgi:hypothetical protein